MGIVEGQLVYYAAYFKWSWLFHLLISDIVKVVRLQKISRRFPEVRVELEHRFKDIAKIRV